jgi:hypothetical protein
MNSVNWKNLKWEEVMPGMRRKVLHAEAFTIVLVDLAPNLDLPCHSHPHEQATLVQRGSLVFTVENDRTDYPFSRCKTSPACSTNKIPWSVLFLYSSRSTASGSM